LVALTAIALALSPVLLAGYLCFDDPQHILENPHLQSASPAGLVALWTRPYFGLYIPLTYSLWWLLAAGVHLVGASLEHGAWLFHAVNLALHLGNTTLTFLLVRALLYRCQASQTKLGGARGQGLALAAALLFGLHPVQVEAVAWIAECKGDLAAFLGLLGTWWYYRSSTRRATALLFVLAMLAKPSAVVFPGLLLVIDRIVLGRSLKAGVAFPVLLWLLMLPLAVLTSSLQPTVNIEFVPSLGQRLYVGADALTFYLGKLLAPASLALDYGRSPRTVLAEAHLAGWRMAVPIVVALAGLAVIIQALARPRPARLWYALLSAGFSVFALALTPVLGFIPFEFQDFTTVADHYLLVPMVGAGLMLAGVLARALEARRERTVAVAVVVLCAALGGASFIQARRWRSTETLFGHTLAVNPRSYLAHYSIAVDLLRSGRLDDSIAEDEQAIAIDPDYLPAQVALGAARIHQGRFQDAVEHYTAVLAANPSTRGKRGPQVASMHNNLGMALYQVGRAAEGSEHFRMAVDLDPQNAVARANLAKARDGQ